MQIAIALFLSVLALASADIEWNNLQVKWNYPSKDPSRLNSFFVVPRTLDDAVSEGWVEVTGVNTTWVTVHCWPDDPRYCVLFDSYGYIAGVQFGILVSDVENVQTAYDMSLVDQFKIKTMFGVEVWTSTAYTQDPAVIASGGRSSTWDNLTGTEGVWFETTDGYLTIDRNLDELDSVWTQEVCVPTIGIHYFYDLHNTTDPTACESLHPWFLLYQGKTLTGIGFQGYGNGTTKDRTWYETITTEQVKYGILTGPQCMFDWSDAYGVISMHMFFTPKPWEFRCS